MVTGILFMIALAGIWSVTPTLVKIALTGFSPFFVAAARLVIGVTVFSLWYAIRGGRLSGVFRVDRWALVGGVGIAINYSFFCLSLSHTTAGAGGLVVQVQFVVLATLAAVILKERFRPLKILGMVAVIAGIVAVLLASGRVGNAFADAYLLGNLLMLVSGTGWACYALSNKASSGSRANLELLIPMLSIGALLTIVAAVITWAIGVDGSPEAAVSAGPGTDAILALIALGVVSTGGGFMLVDGGMRRLSAGLAGTITGITPLGNLLVAHLALGEPLIPMFFVSGVVIASGLAVIVRAERRERLRR